jgi:hypothetical protein
VITIRVYNCKHKAQRIRATILLAFKTKRPRGDPVLGELGGVGSIAKSYQRRPPGVVTWRKVAIPTTDITSRFLNQSSSQSLAAAHFSSQYSPLLFPTGLGNNLHIYAALPQKRPDLVYKQSQPLVGLCRAISTWGAKRFDRIYPDDATPYASVPFTFSDIRPATRLRKKLSSRDPFFQDSQWHLRTVCHGIRLWRLNPFQLRITYRYFHKRRKPCSSPGKVDKRERSFTVSGLNRRRKGQE